MNDFLRPSNAPDSKRGLTPPMFPSPRLSKPTSIKTKSVSHNTIIVLKLLGILAVAMTVMLGIAWLMR